MYSQSYLIRQHRARHGLYNNFAEEMGETPPNTAADRRLLIPVSRKRTLSLSSASPRGVTSPVRNRVVGGGLTTPVSETTSPVSSGAASEAASAATSPRRGENEKRSGEDVVDMSEVSQLLGGRVTPTRPDSSPVTKQSKQSMCLNGVVGSGEGKEGDGSDEFRTPPLSPPTGSRRSSIVQSVSFISDMHKVEDDGSRVAMEHSPSAPTLSGGSTETQENASHGKIKYDPKETVELLVQLPISEARNKATKRVMSEEVSVGVSVSDLTFSEDPCGGAEDISLANEMSAWSEMNQNSMNSNLVDTSKQEADKTVARAEEEGEEEKEGEGKGEGVEVGEGKRVKRQSSAECVLGGGEGTESTIMDTVCIVDTKVPEAEGESVIGENGNGKARSHVVASAASSLPNIEIRIHGAKDKDREKKMCEEIGKGEAKNEKEKAGEIGKSVKKEHRSKRRRSSSSRHSRMDMAPLKLESNGEKSVAGGKQKESEGEDGKEKEKEKERSKRRHDKRRRSSYKEAKHQGLKSDKDRALGLPEGKENKGTESKDRGRESSQESGGSESGSTTPEANKKRRSELSKTEDIESSPFLIKGDLAGYASDSCPRVRGSPSSPTLAGKLPKGQPARKRSVVGRAHSNESVGDTRRGRSLTTGPQSKSKLGDKLSPSSRKSPQMMKETLFNAFLFSFFCATFLFFRFFFFFLSFSPHHPYFSLSSCPSFSFSLLFPFLLHHRST